MLSAISSIFRKPLPQNAPKFLIIGGQKCGTTALHQYLTLHPQVKAATPKELHYFSCDNRFYKGIEYYHSFFPETHGGEITFEASPSYLAKTVAAERIYEYNPNIKIIVLIRDPVERAYSAWNMYNKRYENNRNWFFEEWLIDCNNEGQQVAKRDAYRLLNFNDFITNELEHFGKAGQTTLEAPVIPQGFYYSHLSRYFSLFNRDQFFIIENSNMLENTKRVLCEVESFIGLQPHNWEASELTPIFEGQYSENMDNETRSLLFDLYQADREKLIGLLEKYNSCSADWLTN